MQTYVYVSHIYICIHTYIHTCFWEGNQPVWSCRKLIQNQSISNCGPTSIQQLPDIWFVCCTTGRWFDRLIILIHFLKKEKMLLLLLFKSHSGQKLTENYGRLQIVFSKSVSVFVNYLKWVSEERGRAAISKSSLITFPVNTSSDVLWALMHLLLPNKRERWGDKRSMRVCRSQFILCVCALWCVDLQLKSIWTFTLHSPMKPTWTYILIRKKNKDKKHL